MSATPATPRQFRVWRVFLATWVIVFALLTCWVFASPLGAGPDEPAHIVKAYGVSHGDLAGRIDPALPGDRAFEVPGYIKDFTTMVGCYRFDPSMPGSCLGAIDNQPSEMVEVFSGAGSYNPVYYFLVGWPSYFLDGAKVIHGMRLASALLYSLGIAWGITALASRRRRSWTMLAAAVTLTPMSLFMGAVVNISSMELAAAFAMSASLIALLDRGRRMPRTALILGVLISGTLLANSRSVGPLWFVIIAAALLIDGRLWRELIRSKLFWGAVVVLGGVGGTAYLWMQRVGGSGAPSTLGWGAGVVTPREGIEYMLSRTLEHAAGYVGTFGWLDTRLPDTIILIWGGLLFALVAAALLLGDGWGRVRTLVLTMALIAVPALLQGMSWYTHGHIWQDRYVLAIVFALTLCAGATLDDAIPGLVHLYRGRTTMFLLLAGLLVMHGFAILWNLRRYVTGLDEPKVEWRKMLSEPLWEPSTPGGWPVLVVVFSFAALAWVLLIARLSSRTSRNRRARWRVASGAPQVAVPTAPAVIAPIVVESEVEPVERGTDTVPVASPAHANDDAAVGSEPDRDENTAADEPSADEAAEFEPVAPARADVDADK